MTGYTTSTGTFPTTPNRIRNCVSTDAFITKFAADGVNLVYSTCLGGTSGDFSYGIAVDSAGQAYVTGQTSSTNFPTVNPLQGSLIGSLDAFVAKLTADGSALAYSTYLGGTGTVESGERIAVDAVGQAYVIGVTNSTNFPTTINAFQRSYGGGSSDLFVTKLTTDGSALVYSTYLGGTGAEGANPRNYFGIAADAAGSVYIAARTLSTDFPTANPLPFKGSGTDGVVAKLNPAGTALVYSTYLSGNGTDYAQDIAVDSAGHAYVTGYTQAANFPVTSHAFQVFNGSSAGYYDAFVARIQESAPLLNVTRQGSGDGTVTSTPADIDCGVDCSQAGYAAGTSVTLTATPDSHSTFWQWAGEGCTGQNRTCALLTGSLFQTVAAYFQGAAIAAGSRDSIALKADGTVWAWGNNADGQLGDGTTSIRTTPVPVAGLSEIVATAAGSDHTAALKARRHRLDLGV